jgi:hypothetical protein
MNGEFLTYEEALALDKLGFNEPCFNYVDKYNRDYIYNFQSHLDEFIECCGVDVIASPTYRQAFEWFRKDRGIFTSIVPTKYGRLDSFMGWIYVPQNGTTNDIPVGNRVGFVTPQEAESACLRKLIEIVR